MRVDGWSTTIVFDHFMEYCWALSAGRSLDLPVDHSYKYYLAWLMKQDPNQGEHFWKQMFTAREDKTGIILPTPLVEWSRGQMSPGTREDL